MAVNKKKKSNKKKHTKKKHKNNKKNIKNINNKKTNNKINNKRNIKNNSNDKKNNNKNTVDNNDKTIVKKDNKKISTNILLTTIVAISTLIFIFLIFYFPRIELQGEENISISYNENYIEPGYNFKFLNKDLSKDIIIENNLTTGVIGDYQIKYSISKFGIKFIKNRNISVVDKETPKLEVYSDVINICPNQEIPEIEYKAIDEYDGDITSFVKKTILDNEVILKVSDKSNNKTEKTIHIDRVDSINPVIKLKGNTVTFLEYGSKYIEPGYTVSDNCTNNLEDKVNVKGSVGRDIGTYTLTYEVSDESGNKDSVTRKVIIGTKYNDKGTINNGSIYLTFDDGPNQGTTNKILDILKEEGVKATFFVTCNGPDSLIKRMHDEGHTIALHTATHNYSYIYSSTDNYFNDLNKVKDRVKRITGENSMIIRFPGGSSNTISKNYKKGIMTELSNLVLNEGYRYFDWNVDGRDASTSRNSSDVYYNVTSNLSMNRANMVLMHDTKSITAGAVRDIIRFGKEHGYQFRKIDMNTYMVRHGINN